MKLLITTEPDDFHAIAVKIALEEMEHHVRLYFSADHPSKQSNTVFIDNELYNWKKRLQSEIPAIVMVEASS